MVWIPTTRMRKECSTCCSLTIITSNLSRLARNKLCWHMTTSSKPQTMLDSIMDISVMLLANHRLKAQCIFTKMNLQPGTFYQEMDTIKASICFQPIDLQLSTTSMASKINNGQTLMWISFLNKVTTSILRHIYQTSASKENLSNWCLKQTKSEYWKRNYWYCHSNILQNHTIN